MLVKGSTDIVCNNDKPFCMFNFNNLYAQNSQYALSGEIHIAIIDPMMIDDIIELFAEAINEVYY